MNVIKLKASKKAPPKDGISRNNVHFMHIDTFKDGIELDAFADPAALAKVIILADDEKIMAKSFKKTFGEQLDLDKEAKKAKIDRDKDKDKCFIKNATMMSLLYAYASKYKVDGKTYKYLADDKYWLKVLEKFKYGDSTTIFGPSGKLNKPEPKLVNRDGPIEKPANKSKRSKKDPDEIDLEIENCKAEYDKLVEVAESYGVSKDTCAKYKHFADNGRPGLLAMNIKNRIREALRKKNNK